MGFFDKLFKKNKTDLPPQEQAIQQEVLDAGLLKTKEGFLGKIARAITGKSKVDTDVLDSLEEALISADVGVATTIKIIEKIEQRVAKDKYINTTELNSILKQEIQSLFANEQVTIETATDANTPYVMLIVGVNGVGKTTSIAKLAYSLKQAGKSVLLGAADTFRAAAVDQLTVWSQRVGVDIVKQAQGSDPAAVAFDAVQSGVAKHVDVIMIDTAGRLHNKAHLMDELSKIKRVIQKVIPTAPHEVLLVLDGSTGQNALEQAKQFTAATEVTGLIITKLDGSAKGGVVLAIADQFSIPVRYIGIGEKMTDLIPFNKKDFVDSLFGDIT